MAEGAGTAGIGVVLQSTNASKPEMVVMRLVEGGAAAFARDNGTANQLFAGDVITSVNDMSALGWSLERIKAAISGPVGTWVKVGVRRSGHKLQITLQRLKNASQAASTASVAPTNAFFAPKQQVQAPRTPRSAQGSLVPIEEEKVEPSVESSGHAAEDGAGGARLTAAIETENVWRAERNALKAELAEARRKIEELYASRGYPKTTVSIVEGNKPSDRGVVFVISESKLQRIASVQIIGNDPSLASDARLKTRIKSKPGYFWLIGGRVDRNKIDEDVDRLVAYYRALGYFRARADA